VISPIPQRRGMGRVPLSIPSHYCWGWRKLTTFTRAPEFVLHRFDPSRRGPDSGIQGMEFATIRALFPEQLGI
jgi:hypothetical protein